MPNTFIELNQLDQAGMDELVCLHNQVMHTLLSDLGTDFIKKYYQAAQTGKGIIGFAAFSETGEMTGWVMGSGDPAALNSSLRKPLSWFFGKMLKISISSPAIIIELVGSLLTSSDANRLYDGQCELTYIGVSQNAQGQGLGRELIFKFVEQAKLSGYNSIALSVETDNPAAVSLYQKCNFKILRTFQEGRFHRHRMIMEIK